MICYYFAGSYISVLDRFFNGCYSMDYKLFLKTFFVAFLIFFTVVVLGMKYNWVRFLQADVSQPSEEQATGLPQSPDKKPLSERFPIKKPTGSNSSRNTDQYILVDEDNADQNENNQIRNDCIRASRRAGVTDENIFAVVAQCVEMSTKADNNPSNSEAVPTDVEGEGTGSEEFTQNPPVEEGLELTRKACRIVADEEQGVTDTEREQIVEQCIKANMGN